MMVLASLLLMSAFLRYSRQGMAIRAVSQNMDAAKLMGIPTMAIFLTVMIISAPPQVLRKVTTSTSRYAGAAGSSGSTGVTPWTTRASSTSQSSRPSDAPE